MLANECNDMFNNATSVKYNNRLKYSALGGDSPLKTKVFYYMLHNTIAYTERSFSLLKLQVSLMKFAYIKWLPVAED